MKRYLEEALAVLNPQYFYRVDEEVTTFSIDIGLRTHSTFLDFNHEDLLVSRTAAMRFYHQRYKDFDRDPGHFLPLGAPRNYKSPEHAACRLNLTLVEDYGQGCEFEYVILAADNKVMHKNREYEKDVLRHKGFIKPREHVTPD
jgi:hypothetical protein